MPIYEYLCESCGKGSSALLPSWSTPDGPCPHCLAPALKRQVSRFAAFRSGPSDGFGSGDDFGSGDGMDGTDGEDLGDFGGGDGYGEDDF